MDDKKKEKLSEQFPEPGELFRIEGKTSDELKAMPMYKAKQIPKYRVARFFSKGFLIVLLLLVILFTNLEALGIKIYRMQSNSMESVIPAGSILIVRSVAEDEIKEGDIITYTNFEGISVTHRVIHVIENYKESGYPAFRTKGTENLKSDDNTVTRNMIDGKVIFHYKIKLK